MNDYEYEMDAEIEKRLAEVKLILRHTYHEGIIVGLKRADEIRKEVFTKAEAEKKP